MPPPHCSLVEQLVGTHRRGIELLRVIQHPLLCLEWPSSPSRSAADSISRLWKRHRSAMRNRSCSSLSSACSLPEHSRQAAKAALTLSVEMPAKRSSRNRCWLASKPASVSLARESARVPEPAASTLRPWPADCSRRRGPCPSCDLPPQHDLAPSLNRCHASPGSLGLFRGFEDTGDDGLFCPMTHYVARGLPPKQKRQRIDQN